jgi:hypothetical protein
VHVISTNPLPAADELIQLAEAKFKSALPLTSAERLLLQKAAAGNWAICFPAQGRYKKWNDPADADSWGPERHIRNSLLAMLCADPHMQKLVHWAGIYLYGAYITERVDLSYASIPFQLTLRNCRITAFMDLSASNLVALNLTNSYICRALADGLCVKNDVVLADGFNSQYGMRLRGAHIGGTLDCSSGVFGSAMTTGRASKQKALDANGIIVDGDVFLREGFVANGEIDLVGSQIGNDLVCSGGKLNGIPTALLAHRSIVGGAVFLSDDFWTAGLVDFTGTKITGALGTYRGLFGHGALHLPNVSTRALVDFETEWPKAPRLDLEGFNYGRIANDQRIDVTARLRWLALQKPTPFRPQPYLQLAKIVRDSGDSNGALRVLEKKEQLRRADAERNPLRRLWSWALWAIIGYGYFPGRAILALLLLCAAGWLVYDRGYQAGAMVPTEKEAYIGCSLRRPLPPEYPQFSPFVYSLENSLPLVKFDQAEKWHPDPQNCSSSHSRGLTAPAFLTWFLRAQIVLGWALATLFVAGFSGLVHQQ